MEIISFGIFYFIFHIYFPFPSPFFFLLKSNFTAQSVYLSLRFIHFHHLQNPPPTQNLRHRLGEVPNGRLPLHERPREGGRARCGGVSWGCFNRMKRDVLVVEIPFHPLICGANDPFWQTFLWTNELKPGTGLAFGTKVDMFPYHFWLLLNPHPPKSLCWCFNAVSSLFLKIRAFPETGAQKLPMRGGIFFGWLRQSCPIVIGIKTESNSFCYALPVWVGTPPT